MEGVTGGRLRRYRRRPILARQAAALADPAGTRSAGGRAAPECGPIDGWLCFLGLQDAGRNNRDE